MKQGDQSSADGGPVQADGGGPHLRRPLRRSSAPHTSRQARARSCRLGGTNRATAEWHRM